MEFASAARSCSVEKNGAVPSAREQVQERCCASERTSDIPHGDGQSNSSNSSSSSSSSSILSSNKSSSSRSGSGSLDRVSRGGGGGSSSSSESVDAGAKSASDQNKSKENNDKKDDEAEVFPFMIGSRLNSMKDRPELWGRPLKGPKDYVERQATVRGLTCVDFNYPQHFQDHWTASEAKAALERAGLKAGAVCLRYPSKFARGAINHPEEPYRREAIEVTKQAARLAIDLRCDEVVVWSAYDGYDCPFPVNYEDKWDQLVEAFQECCDEFTTIKFSLEYKPTDENTRFFTVSSTGEAMQLVDDIDRPNMGLTLDVGHMLIAGENPGHSIALVCRREKLFGIQLNDGYKRLAAEDGLLFGSVHPAMALEIMYQLRRYRFKGYFYFDTFPRTDPVKEAEANIRRVKKFWYATSRILSGDNDNNKYDKVTDQHDAIGALDIVDEALQNM